MKTLISHKISILIALFSTLYTNACIAVDIRKPNFVETTDTSTIDSAGAEIALWIGVIFGVLVVVSCSFPAYNLFWKHDKEKAIEQMTNIFYGVAVYILLAGIVFGIFA